MIAVHRVGFALALALFYAGDAFSQEPAAVTLKIIAFNDFHGNLRSPGSFEGVPAGGIDVMAGYVAMLKAHNPNHAVVSAGDLIGASPLVSALFHDEPTIETMNRLGLDFNAAGNHEFDEGPAELLRLQNGGCHPTDRGSTCKGNAAGTPVPFEGARFKFLGANIVRRATGEPVFAPYAIKAFGNVRVGFIGIGLEETPALVSPELVSELAFKPEADSVNEVVPRLRGQGVEAIVVLIHQGGAQRTPPPADVNGCAGNLNDADGTPSALRRIVSRLDDAVDLVISGHSHQAYVCSLPNASGRAVTVTSANAYGRVLTDIDLEVDTATGEVRAVNAKNMVIDRTNPAIVPDRALAQIVDAYEALAAAFANRVVGVITQDVTSAKDRACAIPAGELIADAQLAATQAAALGGAQVAFMNPGGVRSGFLFGQLSGNERPGEITYGEAFAVQPFGNALVTMTLTARQLKDTLEEQFKDCTSTGRPVQTLDRFLLPSRGFRFSWDRSRPPCRRIVSASLALEDSVEHIVEKGLVRDPSRRYRVTVNSFLAMGGDGFTHFRGGTDRLDGPLDIEALTGYFLNFTSPARPYDPTAPDLNKPRIVRLNDGPVCQ